MVRFEQINSKDKLNHHNLFVYTSALLASAWLIVGCMDTNYMNGQHVDKRLRKLKIGMPMEEAYKAMDKPLLYSIPILRYSDSRGNIWNLYFVPTNEVAESFATPEGLSLVAVTRITPSSKDEYYYLPHSVRGKKLTGLKHEQLPADSSHISKPRFYTDDDNMKKYVQLANKADMYICFHSMDDIEVIDVQRNTFKCDIKSLDEYINKNVKNRNIVYMTYSKWARVKYLVDDKKNMQTIIFWENYFAKFGFKRLIIQEASSKRGYCILVDKNIPVMSPKVSGKLGRGKAVFIF